MKEEGIDLQEYRAEQVAKREAAELERARVMQARYNSSRAQVPIAGRSPTGAASGRGSPTGFSMPPPSAAGSLPVVSGPRFRVTTLEEQQAAANAAAARLAAGPPRNSAFTGVTRSLPPGGGSSGGARRKQKKPTRRTRSHIKKQKRRGQTSRRRA